MEEKYTTEINLKGKLLKAFTEDFNNPHYQDIRIVSIDKEDRGKFFKIPLPLVTSIDKDIVGLVIWWKQWNPLEGKYVIMSNHFKEYEFI